MGRIRNLLKRAPIFRQIELAEQLLEAQITIRAIAIAAEHYERGRIATIRRLATDYLAEADPAWEPPAPARLRKKPTEAPTE